MAVAMKILQRNDRGILWKLSFTAEEFSRVYSIVCFETCHGNVCGRKEKKELTCPLQAP